MLDAEVPSLQCGQSRRKDGCRVEKSKDKQEAISIYWSSRQFFMSPAMMCMSCRKSGCLSSWSLETGYDEGKSRGR